jgi:hypothetical protein
LPRPTNKNYPSIVAFKESITPEYSGIIIDTLGGSSSSSSFSIHFKILSPFSAMCRAKKSYSRIPETLYKSSIEKVAVLLISI